MSPVWEDALLAAACIAIDPQGLGGVRVRSGAGPVRDAWVAYWRGLLPASTPIRSVPLHVDRDRLHGGLDLAASLRTGRPVEQPGLLAQVDGGYALLSMAERIDRSTAARIAAVVESGNTGSGGRTRFGLIAFDERDGVDDDAMSATLAERIGLCIDLRPCSIRVLDEEAGTRLTAADIVDARTRLPQVFAGDDVTSALCETALSLGIDSLRMPRYALCAARAIAALDGRTVVDEDDAAHAARLVFATRVRRLPDNGVEEPPADDVGAPETDQPVDPDASNFDEPESSDRGEGRNESEPDDDSTSAPPRPEKHESLDDVVLDAAVAAIPAGLLARLARDAAAQRSASATRSGAGAAARGGARGAPAGVRRARPRPPQRLSLIETLRAAAPWQRLRRAEAPADPSNRVQVRAEDLHIQRYKERHPTTTVFVVDASGSSALHRLAEAKGAVELLLADCYVRRDQVAVLAFRGKDTQMLLPPTRSLVRARRSLAGLPGGGGTPLASALDATRALIVTLRRRGDTALTVLLTDGRANVARDGSGGRPQAEADALVSARALRALQADVLMIDTSPRPYPQAALLAHEMGATYRPLPYAGAAEMSSLIRQAANRAAS